MKKKYPSELVSKWLKMLETGESDLYGISDRWGITITTLHSTLTQHRKRMQQSAGK